MSEGRRFAAKKSIKNWAEYNAGLVRRYDITVYLEDETVFAPPEASGKRGRPPEYSDGLIELGLTIKAIYRLPTSSPLPPTLSSQIGQPSSNPSPPTKS